MPLVECGGFSYDKNSYKCTIIGIPDAMKVIPMDSVKVKSSESEAYFHKVKNIACNFWKRFCGLTKQNAMRNYISLNINITLLDNYN